MGTFIHPKKSLGQHFLKDDNIARKIVKSLHPPVSKLIEVGPGTGVLTRLLLELEGIELLCIETDRELVERLCSQFPDHAKSFIHADFLRFQTAQFFTEDYALIGNFPYNISSQILFKILEERDRVTQVVCMLQKEVAERIATPPGSRRSGILSVLLHAFYDIEYLFTVSENVFFPPPKVKSAVIRLSRNQVRQLDCREEMFFKVVKTAFNQRRKTLRNSLKSFYIDFERGLKDLELKRPEQLRVSDFVRLTNEAV